MSQTDITNCSHVVISTKSQSALTELLLPCLMFTLHAVQQRAPFPLSVMVFDRQCVWIDTYTKKRSKSFTANVVAFEELYFFPSGPSLADTSLSLPYTCLFIFSGFSSPTIPGVCCGPESCSWSSANLERSSAFLEIWEGKKARDWT